MSFVSEGPIDNKVVNGLALNMRQAIKWTSVAL